MRAMLVLASSSPRRLALLSQAGLSPLVRPADVDETVVPGETALAYARRMAGLKARTTWELLDLETRNASVVLAADTVVHRDDHIFDKPGSTAEAATTLASLADSWHQVTTAFALLVPDKPEHIAEVTTRVRFRRLSAADIERYVASGEAADKAGAYGIQGLGGALVDQVEGSYTNVIGLPLPEVLQALAPWISG